jgi:glycogen operon protein
MLPGSPRPLGATWDGKGVNFAVFSECANRIEICLFDSLDAPIERARIALIERTDRVWHGYLPGLAPGQVYGLRVYGPYAPESGVRCNPTKLLVDPYARAISGLRGWHEALVGETNGRIDLQDSGPYAPRCIVIDPAFDWGDDRAPHIPIHDTISYELHVKGFTKLHPELSPDIQGTYAGLGSEPVIAYLNKLGVTSIELLPIHQHVTEPFLARQGRVNYWGYSTLGFFAPDARYSASGATGGQVNEFKQMVKNLHAGGIEVLLDVVYNHTCEAGADGPMLSFRGIDNRAYYRLRPDNPRHYQDYTGCGNTLNILHPRSLQLVMDSLRYWVEEMHVDGFRFDLTTALVRGRHDGDRWSAFLDTIAQDPVLANVKLIAEPWDVGPNGYLVGRFPPPWTEWNGRYRDTVRRFWKGDDITVSEMAFRLTASPDLYANNGRPPVTSVNFITAHDGFTLRDLVSYNYKHNLANGEDNRDGENNNNSWNHGSEGPTTDAEINTLRSRQQRNLLATLLLSHGIPMLTAGDEWGRSQQGNNNAYCQDNELSWMSWEWNNEQTALFEFVRQVIGLRNAHPAFRRRNFFMRRSGASADVFWLRPDGVEVSEREWSHGPSRCMGMLIHGDRLEELDAAGNLINDAELLMLLNAHWQPVDFQLPNGRGKGAWQVLINTAGKALGEHQPGTSYPMIARSFVLLRRGLQ